MKTSDSCGIWTHALSDPEPKSGALDHSAKLSFVDMFRANTYILYNRVPTEA